MQKTVVNLIKNTVTYNHVSKSDKKYHLSNRMNFNSQKRHLENEEKNQIGTNNIYKR